MKQPSKLISIKNALKLATYKDAEKDRKGKGQETKQVTDESGQVLAEFTLKDGKPVSAMGTEGIQNNDQYQKLATKAGYKEDVVQTTPSAMTSEAYDNSETTESDDPEKAKLLQKTAFITGEKKSEETKKENTLDYSKMKAPIDNVPRWKKRLPSVDKPALVERMRQDRLKHGIQKSNNNENEGKTKKFLEAVKSLIESGKPSDPEALKKDPKWAKTKKFLASKTLKKGDYNKEVDDKAKKIKDKNKDKEQPTLDNQIANVKDKYKDYLTKDDSHSAGYKALIARMKQKKELKPGSTNEKIREALRNQPNNPYATPGPYGGSGGVEHRPSGNPKYDKAVENRNSGKFGKLDVDSESARSKLEERIKDKEKNEHVAKLEAAKDRVYRMTHGDEMMAHKDWIENKKNQDEESLKAQDPEGTQVFRTKDEKNKHVGAIRIPGTNRHVTYHGQDEKGNHYFTSKDEGDRSKSWQGDDYAVTPDRQVKPIPKHPNDWHIEENDQESINRYKNSLENKYNTRGAAASLAAVKKHPKYQEAMGRKPKDLGNIEHHPKDFEIRSLGNEPIYNYDNEGNIARDEQGRRAEPAGMKHSIRAERKKGAKGRRQTYDYEYNSNSNTYSPKYVYKEEGLEGHKQVFDNIIKPHVSKFERHKNNPIQYSDEKERQGHKVENKQHLSVVKKSQGNQMNKFDQLKKACSMNKSAPKGVSETKYKDCKEEVAAKQHGSKTSPYNVYAVCASSLKKSCDYMRKADDETPGYKELKARMNQPRQTKPGSTDEKIKAAMSTHGRGTKNKNQQQFESGLPQSWHDEVVDTANSGPINDHRRGIKERPPGSTGLNYNSGSVKREPGASPTKKPEATYNSHFRESNKAVEAARKLIDPATLGAYQGPRLPFSEGYKPLPGKEQEFQDLKAKYEHHSNEGYRLKMKEMDFDEADKKIDSQKQKANDRFGKLDVDSESAINKLMNSLKEHTKRPGNKTSSPKKPHLTVVKSMNKSNPMAAPKPPKSPKLPGAAPQNKPSMPYTNMESKIKDQTKKSVIKAPSTEVAVLSKNDQSEGVNKPHPKSPKGGTSHVGNDVRSGNNEMAKKTHTKILNTLRAMHRPKLTKTDEMPDSGSDFGPATPPTSVTATN